MNWGMVGLCVASEGRELASYKTTNKMPSALQLPIIICSDKSSIREKVCVVEGGGEEELAS